MPPSIFIARQSRLYRAKYAYREKTKRASHYKIILSGNTKGIQIITTSIASSAMLEDRVG